jgi:hypothetical protein
MSLRDSRISLGALLVFIGMLALAQNLDWLRIDSEHVAGIIFLLSGATLFYQSRSDGKQFKFYIGIAAMFVGFAILVDATRMLPDEIIGTAVLWIIAALFLRVHLSKRESYWPIIPAGILFSIGLMVALEGFNLIYGATIGALINFGIAGTFGYLYSVRNEQNRLEWAKYPALGFLGISILVYFSDRHYGVGPIIFSTFLIVAGVALIVQTVRADRRVTPNDQPV